VTFATAEKGAIAGCGMVIGVRHCH
jgi:hypothetical protein